MTQLSPSSPAPQNAVPVRRVALDLLQAIIFDDVNMDRAFAGHAGFAALNGLDRALVRMMVTTTIRRLGQIDDLIKMAFDRDDAPEPPLLLALLRLSVAQIMFMNIPDHAAVHIAVDLAVDVGLQRQKGLVNAILRRIAREGAARVAKQDIAKLNIPAWMIKDWRTHYGARSATLIAEASLQEAPLDFTVRDTKTGKEWATALNGTVLDTHTVRVQDPSGNIDGLPGFADGAWWVQDAAASLPVKLMGDIAGKTAIDLCAAPGGKTAQLVAGGANVTAIDKSSSRTQVLRTNLDRLGMQDKVTMITADGEQWLPPAPVDIVLIDAPCTATGTMRRNPDITLHRTPDDVKRMAVLQAQLLHHATDMIKPDGMIVYAVCSLQHAEGEGQIASFLKSHPDFMLDVVTPGDHPGIADLVKDGMIRALPHHWDTIGGIDGFFIARLRKK